WDLYGCFPFPRRGSGRGGRPEIECRWSAWFPVRVRVLSKTLKISWTAAAHKGFAYFPDFLPGNAYGRRPGTQPRGLPVTTIAEKQFIAAEATPTARKMPVNAVNRIKKLEQLQNRRDSPRPATYFFIQDDKK
ncbi:MAG: hypothetical protein P8X63_13530, partial [Desulfuromonadaceae bacterium]